MPSPKKKRMEMGGRTPMIYGQPAIQILTSLDMFFERFLPTTVLPSADTDWRAAKLKEFVDKDPHRIRGSLGTACKELDLSLSDRHARRVFKFSVGIGIGEYARHRCLFHAAKQLHATNMAVKIIASDAGYLHTRHFAYGFKKPRSVDNDDV